MIPLKDDGTLDLTHILTDHGSFSLVWFQSNFYKLDAAEQFRLINELRRHAETQGRTSMQEKSAKVAKKVGEDPPNTKVVQPKP